MYHCTKFRADNIWFLEPNSLFEERELRFGTCPVCNKKTIELRERRKTDQKIFISRSSKNIEQVIRREQNNIIYRTEDLANLPPNPFGWVYGINLELKNGQLKRFACDWFGNKQPVN